MTAKTRSGALAWARRDRRGVSARRLGDWLHRGSVLPGPKLPQQLSVLDVRVGGVIHRRNFLGTQAGFLSMSSPWLHKAVMQ